mgnify:CR=1 FL=1
MQDRSGSRKQFSENYEEYAYTEQRVRAVQLVADEWVVLAFSSIEHHF